MDTLAEFLTAYVHNAQREGTPAHVMQAIASTSIASGPALGAIVLHLLNEGADPEAIAAEFAAAGIPLTDAARAALDLWGQLLQPADKLEHD